MAQLAYLEDIANLDIRSLQEVIAEAHPRVKHRYRKWEEIEAHLINDGVAPSLSAYLLYEYQFRGKGRRELREDFGIEAEKIIQIIENHVLKNRKES